MVEKAVKTKKDNKERMARQNEENLNIPNSTVSIFTVESSLSFYLPSLLNIHFEPDSCMLKARRNV